MHRTAERNRTTAAADHEAHTQNISLSKLNTMVEIEELLISSREMTVREFYNITHHLIEEHNQRKIDIDSIAVMPSMTSEETPLNILLSQEELSQVESMSLDEYWLRIEKGELTLTNGTTIDSQITRYLKKEFSEKHEEEIKQIINISSYLIRQIVLKEEARDLWKAINPSSLNILFSFASIPAEILTPQLGNSGAIEMIQGFLKVGANSVSTRFPKKLQYTSRTEFDEESGYKDTKSLYEELRINIAYRIGQSCSAIFAEWIDSENSTYLENTLNNAQRILRSWGKEKFISTISMQEGSLAHDIKNLLDERSMTQILQTLSSAPQESEWQTIDVHWQKIKRLLELVNHTASSALTGLKTEQIKLTDAMEEIKGWLNRISTDLNLSPIEPDIDYKKLAILLLTGEYICQTAQNLLEKIHQSATSTWEYEEVERTFKHKNPTTKLIMLAYKHLHQTLVAHIKRPEHLQSFNQMEKHAEVLETHMQCIGLLYHKGAIKPALSSADLAGDIGLSWTDLQCIAYCLTALDATKAIEENDELLSSSVSIQVKNEKVVIHIDQLASVILTMLDQLLINFQQNTKNSYEVLETTADTVSKNAILAISKLATIPWLKTSVQKKSAQTHVTKVIAILLKNPQVLRFWIKVAQAFVAGALCIAVINQKKERKNFVLLSKKAVKCSALSIGYGIKNAGTILKSQTKMGVVLSLYVTQAAGIKVTTTATAAVLLTAFVLLSFPTLPLYLTLLGASAFMIKKGPKSLRPKKNEKPIPANQFNTKKKKPELNLNPTWSLDVGNEARCEFKIL